MNLSPEKLAKNIIDLIWNDITSGNTIKINMDKETKSLQFNKWVEDVTNLIKVASSQRRFLAFFDGSAKPNPGIMSIGGYIESPDKTRLYEYSINLGGGTNNVAEYQSLIHVLNEAGRRGIERLFVRGDSQLIINQVNNKWKVKDPIMKDLHSKAIKAKNKIPNCEIAWQPRSENKEADRLADHVHIL